MSIIMEWQKLEKEEALMILDDVNENCEQDIIKERARVRKKMLPFYKFIDLYEIEGEIIPTPEKGKSISVFGRTYLLWAPDFVIPLDGKSAPIHKVNDILKEFSFLNINENTVPEYLRFFCEFVAGDGGPFFIPENVELSLEPDAEQESGKRPDQPTAGTQSFTINNVHIYYSAHHFKSNFKVGEDGFIEMVSDEPLEGVTTVYTIPTWSEEYKPINLTLKHSWYVNWEKLLDEKIRLLDQKFEGASELEISDFENRQQSREELTAEEFQELLINFSHLDFCLIKGKKVSGRCRLSSKHVSTIEHLVLSDCVFENELVMSNEGIPCQLEIRESIFDKELTFKRIWKGSVKITGCILGRKMVSMNFSSSATRNLDFTGVTVSGEVDIKRTKVYSSLCLDNSTCNSIKIFQCSIKQKGEQRLGSISNVEAKLGGDYSLQNSEFEMLNALNMVCAWLLIANHKKWMDPEKKAEVESGININSLKAEGVHVTEVEASWIDLRNAEINRNVILNNIYVNYYFNSSRCLSHYLNIKPKDGDLTREPSYSVYLESCSINGQLEMDCAAIQFLSLKNSSVRGNVKLTHFRCSLDMENAKCENLSIIGEYPEKKCVANSAIILSLIKSKYISIKNVHADNGLLIEGGRVDGSVSLSSSKIERKLGLSGIFIQNQLQLVDLVVKEKFELNKAKIKDGVKATSWYYDHINDVFLHNKIREIDFTEARVHKQIIGKKGVRILGNLSMDYIESSNIIFSQCVLKGNLSMKGAKISNFHFLGGIEQDLHGKRRFKLGEIYGCVTLDGAEIDGDCVFAEISIQGKKASVFEHFQHTQTAFSAKMVKVKGDFLFTLSAEKLYEIISGLYTSYTGTDSRSLYKTIRKRLAVNKLWKKNEYRFYSSGSIKLDGLKVGGKLDISDAEVKGDISIRYGEIGSEVRIKQTSIFGNLLMTGANISQSLIIVDAKVNQNVDLSTTFVKSRMLIFTVKHRLESSVNIGGNLVLSKAIIGEVSLYAFSLGGDIIADSSTFGSFKILPGLAINREFPFYKTKIKGAIYLNEAKVNGDVEIVGCTFSEKNHLEIVTLDQTNKNAINAESAIILGDLRFLCSLEQLENYRKEQIYLLNKNVYGRPQKNLSSEYETEEDLKNTVAANLNFTAVKIGGDTIFKNIEVWGKTDFTDAVLQRGFNRPGNDQIFDRKGEICCVNQIKTFVYSDFIMKSAVSNEDVNLYNILVKSPFEDDINPGIDASGIKVDGKLDFCGQQIKTTKNYNVLIAGDLNLSKSSINELIISDDSFAIGRTKVASKRNLTFCSDRITNSQNEDYSTFDEINFEDARIGILTIKGCPPSPLNIRGLNVEEWNFDPIIKQPKKKTTSKEKALPYLIFLAQSDKVYKPLYRSIEQKLYDSGDDVASDEIYKEMWRRELEENTSIVNFIRKNFLEAFGYFTTIPNATWLFLGIWFLLSSIFFSYNQTVTPTLQALSRTDAQTKANLTENSHPNVDKWSLSDGFWVAVRYHIPVIPLFARDEWEPSKEHLVFEVQTSSPQKGHFVELAINYIGRLLNNNKVRLFISPEDYAFLVMIAHWIIVPTIVLLISRRVLRRARQGL